MRWRIPPIRAGVLPWALVFGVGACMPATVAQGDVIATGFFSGTIERFDPQTKAQSTFATIASASDPFPGLSGVAYNPLNHRVYASARISNGIYTVDASTGTILGFQSLAANSAPAGLAVDPAGNLYVANNGGNSVSVFDSAWNAVDTIDLPDIGLGNNLPSGLAFDSAQRLVISSFAGGGVFRYDPGTDMVTSLPPSPLANGQVAIDSAGNIHVGGVAFSSDVLKFDADGNPINNPFVTVDDTILPQPPQGYASPDFTSPGGLVIDAEGNILVAALGRTNPTSTADNFQNNGGSFKFAPDGTLLETFGTGLTPLSSITLLPAAVPEPGSLALSALGGLTAALAAWRSRRRARRAAGNGTGNRTGHSPEVR
jgi:DNA-binding beta-propeller fold protein YncE